MLKKGFTIILIIPLFFACEKENNFPYIPSQDKILSKKEITKVELRDWFHKDIIEDSMPGISLDRAYKTLLKNKKGSPVIVAVIDMEIAIGHEDLKDNIWKNADEIPGNNKDDDNNGYTDDIHGWNFLGNAKGENILFANYEYTRIIKKFDSIFKDKTAENIPPEQQENYRTYKSAKETYDERMEYAIKDKKNGDLLYDGYYLAQKELSPYFPEKNYTVEKLDSLKSALSGNKELQEHISFLIDCLKYDITESYIKDYKIKADERIDKLLNLHYNERELLGDNPEDITDIKYGNNIVDANVTLLDHGTLVAGVIAASRSNTTGTKGITDNIKIMSLCISPYGDEHDKDMALAIRYAVNNGAKVINISSGKAFSLRQDWVHEAMKYAADRKVIIISSAGNSGFDLDDTDNFKYPDDTGKNGSELVDNFIKVGASSYSTEVLLHSTSNYGKTTVDIFAPGNKIYTTYPKNQYRSESGTSLASAVTSGVAALLWSYYPDLSAAQVKNIILQSGVTYNIKVEIKQEDGTKKTVPFSGLSKSGKVVNAYNALLMAEKITD